MSILTMPPPAGIPPFPMQTISVAKYHEMIQKGVYAEDDKVELIEGYIVAKMPHGTPHDSTMDQIDVAREGILPVGWKARSQRAITLSDSEPEPDYAIVRFAPRIFATRHPGPSDIGLIIEVADSSLSFDRKDKCRIYARAGIVIYWIVNIPDGIIEVYTQPSGPTAAPSYASRQDFARGDMVPLVLDGISVAALPVSDLLP
jgi:Uma2 family endonuclease